MWFTRGQIKDHLGEVGVGPREPRSGVVGGVMDVLPFMDQAKSCGVLLWYISCPFPTARWSNSRSQWCIGRPRSQHRHRSRIWKTPMTSACRTWGSGNAVLLRKRCSLTYHGRHAPACGPLRKMSAQREPETEIKVLTRFP